jgi:hypothetical protein
MRSNTTDRYADRVIAFLTDRLTADLARIWRRDAEPGAARRPGAPALVAVLDEHLTGLAAGRLPPRHELRLLLFGYGAHPDYDPRWTDLLLADR